MKEHRLVRLTSSQADGTCPGPEPVLQDELPQRQRPAEEKSESDEFTVNTSALISKSGTHKNNVTAFSVTASHFNVESIPLLYFYV